jgi:hypothetical protein
MMSKKTKGPWKNSGSIPFFNIGDVKGVHDDQGNLVAWASPDNMNLIVAAPEMLSSLRFARDMINYSKGLTSGVVYEKLVQAASEIEQAIAKADGNG